MSLSCNNMSQGVHSHLVSPPPWAERMIQGLLLKWKSNISSPASHTRYPLLSVPITHTNTLLTVPVHTVFPHLQQALSFSPAHAYRGESQVIRIQPGLKLDQNLYQKTENPATQPGMFNTSRFHFASILWSCLDRSTPARTDMLKHTHTRLKLQLAKPHSTNAITLTIKLHPSVLLLSQPLSSPFGAFLDPSPVQSQHHIV